MSPHWLEQTITNLALSVKKTKCFSKIKIVFRVYKTITRVRGPAAVLWVAISLTARKQRNLLEARALQCHSSHPAKQRALKITEKVKNTRTVVTTLCGSLRCAFICFLLPQWQQELQISVFASHPGIILGSIEEAGITLKGSLRPQAEAAIH